MSAAFGGASSQGVAYGSKFGSGTNVTARRHPPTAGHPHGQLEWLLGGVSQGHVELAHSLPAAVVGCVAVCGGGEVAMGEAPLPTPPAPKPPALAGPEVAVVSAKGGAFTLNGVALSPPGSSRPRPVNISLRVLVDRSVVESFAQGGRATHASMQFPSRGDNQSEWATDSLSRLLGPLCEIVRNSQCAVFVTTLRCGDDSGAHLAASGWLGLREPCTCPAFFGQGLVNEDRVRSGRGAPENG